MNALGRQAFLLVLISLLQIQITSPTNTYHSAESENPSLDIDLYSFILSPEQTRTLRYYGIELETSTPAGPEHQEDSPLPPFCTQTGSAFVSILQFGTRFYLTANPNYIYFAQSATGNPQANQMLHLVINEDCTSSFKTKEGLFVSLNPNYSYLQLNYSIGPFEKFSILWKGAFFNIQSVASKTHYWTIVDGIARPGEQLTSRFAYRILPNNN